MEANSPTTGPATRRRRPALLIALACSLGVVLLSGWAVAGPVPETVITEPVSVAQYGDAVVLHLRGFDLLRRSHPDLRLDYRLVDTNGVAGTARSVDLSAAWECPAVILEKESLDYDAILVSLCGGGETILRRLYDLSAASDPVPRVPTLASNAVIEPGQFMGAAPVIPLPELTQLVSVAVGPAPRDIALESVTRQVRCDINYPSVSAKNNCAVTRQTAYPSDDTRRSIYVPLKSQLYNPTTGAPTIVAHYLCEVPLDPSWTNGTGDLVVNLGPDDVKVHHSSAKFGLYNILGEGAGGLGQNTGTLAVDGAGNIYFSMVPAQLVRFNIARSEYEIPPLSLNTWMNPFRPSMDEIYGSGGSAKVGQWESYRMVTCMNFSDPPRVFLSTTKNWLVGANYYWSGLFSMTTSHWDNAVAFTNDLRFHVGSWPTCAYSFYDSVVAPNATDRYLHIFDPRGNSLYITSYSGATGGPWRLDFAGDGSLDLFGTAATITDFNSGYSKPRSTKPWNVGMGVGNWWDYGRITMTRNGLKYALTGSQSGGLTGTIEINYDAIAHMLSHPQTFSNILENISGPSLAPAYMATHLPGQDGQLLGVGEYGYYLARLDMKTADPAYVDKTYLNLDSGNPALDLPLAVGLGPYGHVWCELNGEDWLYMGGYTGLTRLRYATNGVPLDRHTMDKFDGRLAAAPLDAAGAGPIKRFRYLQHGLDDRIFLSGSHTADRGGTAYSCGLMSFHRTQLNTLWKLSNMSRCFHTTALSSRIVWKTDGTPVQEFCLRGGVFDEAYAYELPPSDVPANHDPKVFLYEYTSGGPLQDLFGFSLAPENGAVVFDGLAFGGNRRYLVILQGNRFLTYDLSSRRFIDGKSLTYGSGIYFADASQPWLRLIPTPDDRLFCYVAPSASATNASFVAIDVSPDGLLSFTPSLNLHAASASVLNKTYGVVQTFLPDEGHGDGSYDLVLGLPTASPGTLCRQIEDFVPPRRFDLGRTLNVLSTGIGGVSVTGSHPGVAPYSAGCTNSESIMLSVPAAVGDFVFKGWTDAGGALVEVETNVTAVMAEDRAFIATYGTRQFQGTLFKFR